MAYSTSIRFAIVSCLALFCWIASFFMYRTIDERRSFEHKAQLNIQESWADPQFLVGPAILLPYKKTGEKREVFIIFPEELKTHTVFQTEKRYRGIFEVPVYNSSTVFKGRFNLEASLNNPDITIFPKEASIFFYINDSRGIQSCQAKVNDTVVQFEPGIPSDIGRGIHTPLHTLQPDMSFEISLDVRGTKQFRIAPVGKVSACSMEGKWPHPSFIGGILPKERTVTNTEFKATWNVSYLSRAYDQVISFNPKDKETSLAVGSPTEETSHSKIGATAFGVKFVQPVDLYGLCLRATKYGVLFIALTFMAFFLFEVRRKIVIHPIQYVLVGGSLCVFFLLLTSFGEHLGFRLAYFLGSLMIVGQIATYAYFILNSKRDALVMSGVLLGLYGYLYFVLHLEDYAFLIGSLCLFVILCLLMVFSRRIAEMDVRATS